MDTEKKPIEIVSFLKFCLKKITKRNLIRAGIGFLLLFILIPFNIFLSLLRVYSYVFKPIPTLTASPLEHLSRARRILHRRNRSELLYAAVEIRFAVERMAHRELIFADAASKRMLDEPDPKKKISYLHKLNPEAAFPHEIYLKNRVTGERIRWASYKPLDKKKVEKIKGRLGDLLHPKEGLLLGMPNDPWYTNTRNFLVESLDYLEVMFKDNTAFFTYDGIEHIEMERADGNSSKSDSERL